ncbi:hypothetical protein [Streptococcus suis]
MTVIADVYQHYTQEQIEKMEQRQRSKDEAETFLTQLFGQRAAWVMIANIMEQGRRASKNRFLTFEEAWQTLDYKTVTDIIFRVINGLPCAEKDTGEKEALLKARVSA